MLWFKSETKRYEGKGLYALLNKETNRTILHATLGILSFAIRFTEYNAMFNYLHVYTINLNTNFTINVVYRYI